MFTLKVVPLYDVYPFINKQLLLSLTSLHFIEVERKGVTAGRCVASVDLDWRLLALTRRGDEKTMVDPDGDSRIYS